MLRKISIIIIVLVTSVNSHAQEKYDFYLNKYFEAHTNDKPWYLRIAVKSGEYWAYSDYDAKERLVQAGYFTDTFFTKPVGHYVHYKENGEKYFDGNFENSVPSGTWYFYNKNIIVDSLHYQTAEAFPIPPTDKKETLTTDTTGLTEVTNVTDTAITFTKVEVEASFQGGEKGWVKYLTKKMEDMPDMVSEDLKQGKYTTTVQFVVCTDGMVCDVEALSSVHPLFDLLAINSIRKGPKWKPASQNYRNVKAYRRQRISLVIPD